MKVKHAYKGFAASIYSPILPERPHVTACYSYLHTKYKLFLIAALFIVSPLHCIKPQRVLAYILYQTGKAMRIKEENICLLSHYLCSLAALQELSPGSLILAVSWSDFREVQPMACLKDHL